MAPGRRGPQRRRTTPDVCRRCALLGRTRATPHLARWPLSRPAGARSGRERCWRAAFERGAHAGGGRRVVRWAERSAVVAGVGNQQHFETRWANMNDMARMWPCQGGSMLRSRMAWQEPAGPGRPGASQFAPGGIDARRGRLRTHSGHPLFRLRICGHFAGLLQFPQRWPADLPNASKPRPSCAFRSPASPPYSPPAAHVCHLPRARPPAVRLVWLAAARAPANRC